MTASASAELAAWAPAIIACGALALHWYSIRRKVEEMRENAGLNIEKFRCYLFDNKGRQVYCSQECADAIKMDIAARASAINGRITELAGKTLTMEAHEQICENRQLKVSNEVSRQLQQMETRILEKLQQNNETLVSVIRELVR